MSSDETNRRIAVAIPVEDEAHAEEKPKQEPAWHVRVIASNQEHDPAKDVVVVQLNREQEPKVLRIYQDHIETDVHEDAIQRDKGMDIAFVEPTMRTRRLFYDDWIIGSKALHLLRQIFIDKNGKVKEA